MELVEYFKKHNLKASPWAEKHNLSTTVISRFIRGEGNGMGLSLTNALKIEQACNGEVTIRDLSKRYNTLNGD